MKWNSIKYMIKLIQIIYIFLLGTIFIFAISQEVLEDNLLQVQEGLISSNEQVLMGAELYKLHCAVCHGKTGLGLEEAKLAFPKEHRKCTHCHKSNNSKLIDWSNIIDNNMFALGQAPSLRNKEELAKYSNALVLYEYIRTTMPRYEPRRQTDQEYLAIVAFLLSMNNINHHSELTYENMALLSLK